MCLSRVDLLPAGQRTHDDVVAPVLFKLYDPLSQAPVQDSDLDPSIPSNVRSKVKKLQADLASGKVHAFTGPIYDQKGI